MFRRLDHIAGEVLFYGCAVVGLGIVLVVIGVFIAVGLGVAPHLFGGN